uniref:Uncharacterized protein n=1 Tax=viral metagenome TaxID=1070528 RepID=A0A6C0AYY0_9ZZZZ
MEAVIPVISGYLPPKTINILRLVSQTIRQTVLTDCLCNYNCKPTCKCKCNICNSRLSF